MGEQVTDDLKARVAEFVKLPHEKTYHYTNDMRTGGWHTDGATEERSRTAELDKLWPEVVLALEDRLAHYHTDLFDCPTCELLAKIVAAVDKGGE